MLKLQLFQSPAPTQFLFWLCAVPLLLNGQARPKINSIVSTADFQPGIAFGGLATILGTGLSDAVYPAAPQPYPQQIGRTQVFICYFAPVPLSQAADIINYLGCVPTSLLYVSLTQINFLVPASPPTPPNVVGAPAAPNAAASFIFVVTVAGVTDQNASTTTSIPYSLSAAPRIFFEGYDCFIDPRYQDANENCGLTITAGTTYQADRGAVTDQNGQLLTSANPARIGEYYTIWATGFGMFQNGKPLSPVLLSLTSPSDVIDPLIIDTRTTDPVPYEGVFQSAQSPGLNQINFRLPDVSQQMAGYGNLLPCGNYNWELSINLSQGIGLLAQYANLVQIPVIVRVGDIPCQ